MICMDIHVYITKGEENQRGQGTTFQTLSFIFMQFKLGTSNHIHQAIPFSAAKDWLQHCKTAGFLVSYYKET